MQTTPMMSWPQRLRADTVDPNEAGDDTVIAAPGYARPQTGLSERWRGTLLCASAARCVVLPSSSPDFFTFFFVSAAILPPAGRPSSGIGSTSDAGLLIGIHESVIAVAGQHPIEKV